MNTGSASPNVTDETLKDIGFNPAAAFAFIGVHHCVRRSRTCG